MAAYDEFYMHLENSNVFLHFNRTSISFTINTKQQHSNHKRDNPYKPQTCCPEFLPDLDQLLTLPDCN